MQKKKMSQDIEAARAKYGDPSWLHRLQNDCHNKWLHSDHYYELAAVGDNDLAAADIQEQHDFYNYNRANYQYHDEIDMTGNATTELNIQHGHSEEQ